LNDVSLFSREGAQPLGIAIKRRNLAPSRQGYFRTGPLDSFRRSQDDQLTFGRDVKAMGKTLD
jgi:hypothetical protein